MLCLDYYHADERLNNTAKALFPNDDERRQKWCEKKAEQLIQGHLASFFRDFRVVVRNAQNSGNTELATLLDAQMNYFKERRNYLCYRKCLDEGLLIGSGMIEGGVRFVAKDRLYRTGMIWNTEGADDGAKAEIAGRVISQLRQKAAETGSMRVNSPGRPALQRGKLREKKSHPGGPGFICYCRMIA
jgi:hypothetical protein